MAYVINPDGTITTVEADYDRNGNLKPKIDSKLLNEETISYNRNTDSTTNRQNVSSPTPKRRKKTARRIPPSKQKFFISKAEIDFFFKDRISSRKKITNEEYSKILLSLSEELKDYFVSRFLRYKGYRPSVDDDFRTRKSFKKTKNKKKAANKKRDTHVVRDVSIDYSNRSGYSLGEIASYSSLNKRTPDGDMVNRYLVHQESQNLDMLVTVLEEYKKETALMKSVGMNFLMHKIIKGIMTIPVMTLTMIMMEHIVIGSNT